MSKKFTRNIENFKCEHCGFEVVGNGYTNHCPECLWSKHVDVNPGDRESLCEGMMTPIAIEKDGDKYFVRQKCQKCGFQRRNGVLKDDNFEQVINLSKRLIC